MELTPLEMTPRQRAKAYAAGEEVDRIPTTLSAGETAPPLYGIDICDYYFSADAMVEVESALARDFGADNMGMGLGLRAVPEALGTRLVYPRDAVSFIDEPVLRTLPEVDCLDIVNVNRDGRLPLFIEAFERLQETFGAERVVSSGLAGPFTTACGLVDAEQLLKAMLKDKAAVHHLMQFATDCVVACTHDLHERLGIAFSLSEPMCSRNLLSKRQFIEFCKPYLAQAVRRMNGFQQATSLHICGMTKDRWEDVVDVGVSGFWMDDCESLEEAKRFHGQSIALMGNLPPLDVLRDGTPADIAEGVRRCIAAAGDNPRGYCLCPGCTTPVATSREHLIAFMNAAARYGRFARKGSMPEGMRREDLPPAAIHDTFGEAGSAQGRSLQEKETVLDD